MKQAILEHLQSMCPDPTEIEITDTAWADPLTPQALIVTYTFDGRRQKAVYYPEDDILFTPTDWQGLVPENDEFDRVDWMNSAGDEALVVQGLPRVFSSLRDDARKEFGERVRTLREEAGLSQTLLASRCGLVQPAVGRIESGRYNVTLDTMTRLRAVLPDL